MKSNYRRRFTLAISAYSFFLIFVTLTTMWLMFEVIEGTYQSEEQVNTFGKGIDSVLQQPKIAELTVKSSAFDLYFDRQALPTNLQRFDTFGFHQLSSQEQLIIGSHPKNGKKYYLVLHLQGEQDFFEEELYDMIFVVFATIFTSVLVVLSVLYMAKKLTSPVIELQEMVKNIDIDSDQLPLLERDDEIGDLSKQFSALINKMRHFTRREREFTRFASHELRTPVTIIRGNFDLIEKTLPNSDLNQRTLRRMDTAIKRMSNLIEVFLWLGREQQQQDLFTTETIDKPELDKLLSQALDTLPQAVRADIELQVADIHWRLKPVILTMVIDNLLRNALQHSDGNIKLVAQGMSLMISNTFSGDTELFTPGIGLQIVQRISEANHWRMSIATTGSLFKVTLAFAAPADELNGGDTY